MSLSASLKSIVSQGTWCEVSDLPFNAKVLLENAVLELSTQIMVLFSQGTSKTHPLHFSSGILRKFLRFGCSTFPVSELSSQQDEVRCMARQVQSFSECLSRSSWSSHVGDYTKALLPAADNLNVHNVARARRYISISVAERVTKDKLRSCFPDHIWDHFHFGALRLIASAILSTFQQRLRLKRTREDVSSPSHFSISELLQCLDGIQQNFIKTKIDTECELIEVVSSERFSMNAKVRHLLTILCEIPFVLAQIQFLTELLSLTGSVEELKEFLQITC